MPHIIISSKFLQQTHISNMGGIYTGADSLDQVKLRCLMSSHHVAVSYTHLTLPTNREV